VTAAASHPTPPINLSVIGRLTKPAAIRYSSGGLPHLTVVVQASEGIPFITCKHGKPEDGHALEDLARQLHTGTPVMLVGAGLEVEPDHEEIGPRPAHADHWRIRLMECKQICVMQITDPAEAARV